MSKVGFTGREVSLIFVFSFITIFLALIGFRLGQNDGGSEAVANSTSSSYSEIVDDLNSGAKLLDVRTLGEYYDMHVIEADWFDVEKLKEGRLPDIGRSTTVYVYCNSGNRSGQAKEILEAAGYINIIDLGGVSDVLNQGAAFIRTPVPSVEDAKKEIGEEISDPTLGDDNAPVEFVQYFDFLCPYCSRYALETGPELKKLYVDNGKMRFVYKTASYRGAESTNASAAAYCAHEQDEFWKFYEIMLANIAQGGADAVDASYLFQYAQAIGLNLNTFKDCVLEGKYVNLVRAESKDSQNNGVTGTPQFSVNGETINGAVPLADFQKVIDSKL